MSCRQSETRFTVETKRVTLFLLSLLCVTILSGKRDASKITQTSQEITLERRVFNSTRLILTGASENHAEVLKEWLEVHSFLREYCTVIVYDLGMKLDSRERLAATHTWVHWETFLYDSYPDHVNITNASGCYAWKPLIISKYASQPVSILWLDSGVRMTGGANALNWIFDHIDSRGFFTTSTGPSVRRWVHKGTRDFLLGTNQSDFLNLEVCNAAVLGFHHRSPIPSDFAACALDAECICPRTSSRANHRQDQAVVTILLYLHFGISLRFPPQVGFTLHTSQYEHKGE